MQKTNLRYFNYRSVYYTSHAVQVQAAHERERQRGELIARHCEPFWNYWFPPVYFIGILVNGMGGPASEPDAFPDYVRQFRLREKNTGEDMGVELNYIYLCLDRFRKSAEESREPIDRFMYSLKNISGLEEMPEGFGDSEEMAELFKRSLWANLPVDTAHEIEIHKNMTTKNDILVALAEAREDAREKALAEGEAKGKAEGITEGKVEVARAMLKEALPIETICRVTGLTKEQVRNL